MRLLKRWLRRWLYWWSDSRHEPYIVVTRTIEDVSEFTAYEIRNRIEKVSNYYGYHHTDLAFDVMRLMSKYGLTFDESLELQRNRLEAEYDS